MSRKNGHRVKPSRLIALLLGGSAALILAAVILLRTFDVKLGQGSFFYRYSTLQEARALRCWPVLLFAAGGIAALWLLCDPRRWMRRVGIIAGFLTACALAGWTWWAPPNPVVQHCFNFRSPSHEGAFLLEAELSHSAAQYLHLFDKRIDLTKDQMGGTRVLSNPPGASLLMRGMLWLFPPRTDPPGWLERLAFAQDAEVPEAAEWSSALRVALGFHLLWAISVVPLYLLGRVFLPASGAAVFALIAFVNPSTVLFAPGKDPAQLLTISAMLWAWFYGWKRDSVLLSAIAGALLVIGSTIGLIHVWVTLAATAATIWHQHGDDSLRRLLPRQIIPATLGAIVVLVVVYLVTGWNVLATLLAVRRRFAEIQATLELSRGIWLLIGLPIFLLFLSPGLVATLTLSIRRFTRGGGLGRRLLICTAAVMGITYILGVPYELPRLWVAFIPLLTLGAIIDLPLFHGRSTRRTFKPLALFVIAQILFTAMHWTLLDVRESEYRLLEQPEQPPVLWG